jgi:hypothetical protein
MYPLIRFHQNLSDFVETDSFSGTGPAARQVYIMDAEHR